MAASRYSARSVQLPVGGRPTSVYQSRLRRHGQLTYVWRRFPLQEIGILCPMARKTRMLASSGFDALKWRCIGPSRGGRVVAVSGDPVNKMVFYFGACAGGICKTAEAGKPSRAIWRPTTKRQPPRCRGAKVWLAYTAWLIGGPQPSYLPISLASVPAQGHPFGCRTLRSRIGAGGARRPTWTQEWLPRGNMLDRAARQFTP
jgi:hypothetical protein